jgi:hypothetical protein
MTDGEWGLFVTQLEATFRGELGDDREAALRVHFGRVPFEWAGCAFGDLVERGQVFMPVSSELVAALRRVVGSAWHTRRLLHGRSVAEQEEADAQAARAAVVVSERRLLAEGARHDAA